MRGQTSLMVSGVGDYSLPWLFVRSSIIFCFFFRWMDGCGMIILIPNSTFSYPG